MASAAVDGAVFGAGGFPPVVTTTAAITSTRQASQPRMNARPFLGPLSALSSRTKAVTGNGSRVIPRPMSSRSRTTGRLPASLAGTARPARPGRPAGHRPLSAAIRPDATASTSDW
jgi:hypothetical protein